MSSILNLPTENSDMYIITNFNKLNVGFHVQKVHGIHRLSWTQINMPDATINGGGQGVATGIVKLGEKLLVIRSGISLGVTCVKSNARRIREHIKHVILGL